jgi:large-conductance mechanosensitive channel
MGNDNFILTDQIIFDPKPEAVPYQYRLSYKMALTCLILGMACGKGGCSLSKLHLISVSMYSEKEMNNLLNYVNGKPDTYLILRYDPTINKTIDFMLIENILFQQANGLFRLTKSGRKFLNKIKKDKELLKKEKDFLIQLSNGLTEDLIESIKKSLLG